MGVRRSLAGIPAGVLGCSVALVLGACGGGDDSVADPPVSSTTSSPTESPQHESAEHFIRRWAEAEKRMENTGETRRYLALSRGCEACRTLARRVERYYAAGGYVKWGGWRILSIDVNSKQKNSTTYAVRNNSLPTEYKTSSKAPVHHFSGGVTTELLQLQRLSDSWNVSSKAELAS
jgi:hypothetical protein